MKHLIVLISILFLSFSTFAASPPGLQKKGMSTTPSFLGKTPPGWSQGVKRGWNKDMKNWRWDKQDKVWENKNWHWDPASNSWRKGGFGPKHRR